MKTAAASCSVEAQGFGIEGPLRTDLSIDGDRATLNSGVDGLRISHRGAELGNVSSISTTLTSGRLRLTNFLTDTSFAARAVARFAD